MSLLTDLESKAEELALSVLKSLEPVIIELVKKELQSLLEGL